MSTRPLAKALHTVTVVARVAASIARRESVVSAATPTLCCADALYLLGYEDESALVAAGAELSPLLAACLAACVAAVAKG